MSADERVARTFMPDPAGFVNPEVLATEKHRHFKV